MLIDKDAVLRIWPICLDENKLSVVNGGVDDIGYVLYKVDREVVESKEEFFAYVLQHKLDVGVISCKLNDSNQIGEHIDDLNTMAQTNREDYKNVIREWGSFTRVNVPLVLDKEGKFINEEFYLDCIVEGTDFQLFSSDRDEYVFIELMT